MRQVFKLGCAGLLVISLLAVAISALSNLGLSERSEVVDRLFSAERTRLAGGLHLRQEPGDPVCPGC